VNGPLVRNRTGLTLSFEGSESLEQQAVRAAAGDGLFTTLVAQPSRRLGFSARVEQAFNPSQTLRVEIRRRHDRASNQGIGEFDLPERAYARERTNGRLRVSHRTALPSLVNDMRVQFEWDAVESSSASDATTIRVLDAFTSGGAQRSGGGRTKELEIENDLELTIGQQHQITTGMRLRADYYSGDESQNQSGTFTFASLDDFAAGTPTTFTQRIGDPRYAYSMYRADWNVQDNYRIRRNLLLNLGLRHDMQTHLADWSNFSPRLGLNWTPFPGRRTTVRASYGIFQEYFDASLYEETLRVNGLQQSDLVIADPGYPDPFAAGVLQASRPPGIVRARDDIGMGSTRRLQIAVDQPLTSWARLRTRFDRETGHDLFRSIDANAPIDGVRPDSTVRNITQIESTGRSIARSLEVELALTHQPRRFTSSVRYTLGEEFDETDGALTLPPDSFDLSREWAPSRQDVRHRLNVSVTSDLLAGFRLNTNFRAQSAAPYTITTGLDANGDGFSNERPVGIARNSVRGVGTTNLDLTLTWGVPLGGQAADGQAGGGEGRSRGGRRANDGSRLEIYARATNLLNAVNLQRFSGVMTSPFFGRPTSASAARRIVLGTRVRL
jgi:hypothetical protein